MLAIYKTEVFGKSIKSYLVTRNGPATLGHKLLGALVNVRLSSGNLVLYIR